MEIEKEQIIRLKNIDGNRFFRKNPFKLFGSNKHKYQLNDCLSEVEILDFEKNNQIELPQDYRKFIKNIGNGGAGPAYGIFKLENWNFELDIENRNFVKENFPYTEKWSLPYNENMDDEDYAESEEFKNRELEYFSEKHIYGSIRICHYGCAIYCFLVVSGIEKGNVWIDSRANDDGIYPFASELKSRYNFAEWYNEWINESLKKLIK